MAKGKKRSTKDKEKSMEDASAKPRSANADMMMRPNSNRWFLWFVFIGSIVGSMAVMAYFRIPPSQAPVLTYKVLNTFEHDRNAFTQGLLIDDGKMYEGTGREGQSTIRIVDIATGKPIIKRKLPDNYFGEGITIHGSKLYQLTYRNRKILIYDKGTLDLIEEKDFPYEGWGLTSDSDYLILSDGSDTIRFLNPDTFELVNKIVVRDGKRKISELNELEYFDGRIYANVWHEDFILQIIPATGRVSARIELDGLLDPPMQDPEACLNGIAVDKSTSPPSFYLTGKLWPKMFEVRIVEKKAAAKSE